uniref:Uncharacterized protein n=1 Tax=Anguilla anguilla TaxID=7936 RepID=A0A0E9W6I0_ANGAN
MLFRVMFMREYRACYMLIILLIHGCLQNEVSFTFCS